MLFDIALAFAKTLLAGLIARWLGARQQKEEISDAVKPYKDEAAALAAPDDSKHDNVVRLRDDISG